MDTRGIVAGSIVKHFKRDTSKGKNDGIYMVVCTDALNTETEEQMVVYKALYGVGKTFVRPAEMFFSKVDKEKYPDVQQEYRMELFEDYTKL